jgi:hypothetical protein
MKIKYHESQSLTTAPLPPLPAEREGMSDSPPVPTERHVDAPESFARPEKALANGKHVYGIEPILFGSSGTAIEGGYPLALHTNSRPPRSTNSTRRLGSRISPCAYRITVSMLQHSSDCAAMQRRRVRPPALQSRHPEMPAPLGS